MEIEQFFKELDDKIKEMSLRATISLSPTSYKSGFSEGAKWAYELLSKEEKWIISKYDEFSAASDLLCKQFSKYNDDLKFTIDQFNEAVAKLSNKAKE